MDQFGAHKTDQVLSTTAELTIEIILIPEGATGIYQPLDRRVFGALKSNGRAKRMRFYAENYRRPCKRGTVASLLLESWDELSDSVMTAAWEFHEDEPDNDSDDSGDKFELQVDKDGEDLNGEVDSDKEEEANETTTKNWSMGKRSSRKCSTMFKKRISNSIGSLLA
jgi:hypothetical protein